jgi:hypothetical protein
MRRQRHPSIRPELVRRLGSTCHREYRQRPAAAALALMGIAALGLSAALVAAHHSLIAQLVGGLSLVPLALATFLRLLPPPPWTEEGTDGWRHGQGRDNDKPWPPDGPAFEFDWESLEQEFRAYAEDRMSALFPG